MIIFFNVKYSILFCAILGLLFAGSIVTAQERNHIKNTDLKNEILSEGKETIIFSTIAPEYTIEFKQFHSIYSEAFRRLGYNFELRNYPGERAIIEADIGNVDGTAARISYLNESMAYPNLEKVDESIITMEDGAFATNFSIEINGWSSLQGKQYTIGYLKGYKSVEYNLVKFKLRKNAISFSSLKQMIEMQKAGRIDFFVYSGSLIAMERLSTDGKSIIKKIGILEEKLLYPYLNRKHKKLTEDLAVILRIIKTDGSYEKLLKPDE